MDSVWGGKAPDEAASLPVDAAAAAPSTPCMNAEDDVYYRTETSRVLAELVRPLPCTDTGHERERLLWAFLLRAIQTQLYIRACTAL